MNATGPDSASYGQADSTVPGSWQHPAAETAFINLDIERAKSRYDWFVAVCCDGRQLICPRKELARTLSAEILNGHLRAENAADVYEKKGDRWSQGATTVRSIAEKTFRLQALYQPMWAHTRWGGIWGFFVGAGIFAINALVANFFLNQRFAALLCVAFAAILIPRIGGVVSGICFALLGILGQVVPVFAVLGAIVTGMILGFATGMAIGGAVGYVRQQNMIKAPDAEPESSHLLWTALVLPALGSVALWSVYVFVVLDWASNLTHGAFSLRIPG